LRVHTRQEVLHKNSNELISFVSDSIVTRVVNQKGFIFGAACSERFKNETHTERAQHAAVPARPSVSSMPRVGLGACRIL